MGGWGYSPALFGVGGYAYVGEGTPCCECGWWGYSGGMWYAPFIGDCMLPCGIMCVDGECCLWISGIGGTGGMISGAWGVVLSACEC